MDSEKFLDNFDNLNDLLIEIEAQLVRDQLNKELLIREAFLLWYVLVEGEQCESFSEEQLEMLLHKNFEKYKKSFAHCEDYNFIIGWMTTIAFWYYDSSVDESYGSNLLLTAHRKNKNNPLFKWAVRDDLRLNEAEVSNLKKEIVEKFYDYYNYGPMIKEYFIDVM